MLSESYSESFNFYIQHFNKHTKLAIMAQIFVVADLNGQVRGARNMKSMRLPLVAIFFMTYFHRAGGVLPPWPPPESATDLQFPYYLDLKMIVQVGAWLIRTQQFEVALNSKFLWNFCQIPTISFSKCTVNSDMVNLKFHQFKGNLTVV